MARRRLRRGVVVALAVAFVVVVAIAVALVVRSRQVERSSEALCAQLTLAQDLDESLVSLDPASVEPQVAALRRAKEVAPDEIRAAVVTLADFVEDVSAAATTTGGDPQTALADALESRQGDVDAATAAGVAVQQWAQVNCGLSLSGSGEPAPPADTTTTAAR